MTPEQIATASDETERLAHNLDITNVYHIALWLCENLSDASPTWLACRIVEAHEAILSALKAQQPGEDVVERVARALAPHMEGGREFDQMPHDRMALRKWAREGMCNTNDATQDDALEAARAAIAAMQEKPND